MSGARRPRRPHWPLLSAVLLAVLLACAAEHVTAAADGGGDETCAEEGSCGKEEAQDGHDSSEAAAEDDTPYVCDFVEGLDFYERLGVPRDADERAIKKAFRKLSLTHHPDKVKGKAEEKECSQNHFIAISRAYETLSDEEKRRKVARSVRACVRTCVRACVRARVDWRVGMVRANRTARAHATMCVCARARVGAWGRARACACAHAHTNTIHKNTH